MLNLTSMWAFGKAVIAGALAGSIPLLPFTLLMAVFAASSGIEGPGDLIEIVALALLPLLISLSIVIVASIVVGLPLTWVLKRNGWENAAIYVCVGATVGIAIMIAGALVMEAPEAYWFALPGAIGGAVTGGVWWKSSRSQRRQTQGAAPRQLT